MYKIHILQKYTQKNMHKNDSRSITTVFPSLPACLSVDLDKNISRISLDSSFFFFGTET